VGRSLCDGAEGWALNRGLQAAARFQYANRPGNAPRRHDRDRCSIQPADRRRGEARRKRAEELRLAAPTRHAAVMWLFAESAVLLFVVHCPSSNASFLTIRLALLTLKPFAGATGRLRMVRRGQRTLPPRQPAADEPVAPENGSGIMR
jgi:hypothetical protein